MKRITFTLSLALLALVGATIPRGAAQNGCALTVAPVIEEERVIYEIFASGLPPGAEVEVVAKNKQTRQRQIFSIELEPGQTGFSKIFIGKESNGEFIPVSPGKWKVKVTAFNDTGKCKKKAKFSVKFTSLLDDAPSGTWGGRSAALNTSEEGGTIEFDCAHGSINQPLALDDSGRFDVTGVFVRERPGPVREDEPQDSHPARYTGWTDGKTLVIMVELTDIKETVGPFYLTLDEAPRLVKCL